MVPVLVILVGLAAVLVTPFLLDQVERRTVSPPAIITHATRSRHTTPEMLEALIAVSLHDTVAEIFGTAAPGGQPVGTTPR